MNLRVFCLLPLIITLISCNTKEKNSPDQQTNMQIIDPHSFAKTNEAVVKHLSWKAKIDLLEFESIQQSYRGDLS